MTSAPVLDTAFGLHCVAGNEALYRKLLAKFLVQQGDAVTAVHNALAEGDADRAHARIHTLKGVAASLGLTRLNNTAAAMDTLHKEGNDMAPLLPELADDLDETLRLVTAFLDATA